MPGCNKEARTRGLCNTHYTTAHNRKKFLNGTIEDGIASVIETPRFEWGGRRKMRRVPGPTVVKTKFPESQDYYPQETHDGGYIGTMKRHKPDGCETIIVRDSLLREGGAPRLQYLLQEARNNNQCKVLLVFADAPLSA